MTFERFDTRQFEHVPADTKRAVTVPSRSDPRIGEAHAALDRLECMRAPKSMSEEQWFELLKDLRHVASNWLDVALSCGWSLTDLFGCPPGLRGRVGLMGVAVLLKGRQIESVDRDAISIGNRLGPANLYRRHSPAASEPFDMRGSELIWDVISKEQNP